MKTQLNALSRTTKTIAGVLLALLVASPLAAADEQGRSKALAAAMESEGFEITSNQVRPGIVQVAGVRGSHRVKIKAQSFATLPNRTSGIVGLLKQANAAAPNTARRKVKLSGAQAAYLSFSSKGPTLLFATKDQAGTFEWIGNPEREEYQRLAAKLAGALGGSAGGSAKGMSGLLKNSLSGGGASSASNSAGTDPVLSAPGSAGRTLNSAGPVAPGISTPKTQVSGAGFYVAKDLILTSGLVAPGAKQVRLTDSEGRSFSGEVVARSKEGDLSLALIRTTRLGEALPLAKPLSDQAVFAFGSSKERRAKTKGKLERTDKGAFVVGETVLGADHLGGPLVDGEGRAVGLLFTRTTGQGSEACAVPAATLKAWLSEAGAKVDLASPSPATQLYTSKRVQSSIVRVEAR